MRRLSKGILLFVAMSVLIAVPVLAWIVNQGTMANVSLTVRRAEAEWEEVEIEVGEVNSGASFSATGMTVLTIANAETLNVSFAIITIDDEEAAALQSLTVMIGPDEDDNGEMDYPWAETSVTPITLPMPVPPGVPLSSGDYNVVILVEGIAGYPEVETPIGFEVTCEVTPITLP